MQYYCSVCQQKVNGDMMLYRDHIDKHIVELVKLDHPDWVEKSGICSKCEAYYRGQLQGSPFGDVACVKRTRTFRKFISNIGKPFSKAK